MRILLRACAPITMIGISLIAACAEREDVVGPRTAEGGRELKPSDCGYIYTVTVTPDTVEAPIPGEEPQIVEFLVDIDEDGCAPGHSLEGVIVEFFPVDSGAPTGLFITDSLPESGWRFNEYEDHPFWSLWVYSDANGVVRVPFRTSGIVGENRIDVFPWRDDWTAGPSTTMSVVTLQSDSCSQVDFLQDASVIDALRNLWDESNPDDPDLEDRRETGAWIKEDAEGLEVVPVNIVRSDACSASYLRNPPAETVAHIHTHPLLNQTVPSGVCPSAPLGGRSGEGPTDPTDFHAAAFVEEELGRSIDHFIIDAEGVIRFRVKLENGIPVLDGDWQRFGKCSVVPLSDSKRFMNLG